MDAPILAWYFASTDRKALHGGATLRAGVTECFEGELVLGHRGLHASCDPIDALILGHGPIACRVELMGELCEGDTQLCASQRSVHWLADASDLLRARAREALAQHVDADLEDEAGLRRLLEQAREEVEVRFDELRDGEWKKHERGEDVDLEALRSSVETARVRSRVIDSALRLCSDRVQAIRSVYEFLREIGITPDLASSLEALPRLEKQSPPSLEAHPLDPITVRKGPLYDARDALGRELGMIGWITRAAFGVRHPDGAHVLFIETKPRRNPKPKRDARLIIERISGLLTIEQLLLVVDRGHAFQFALERATLLNDAAEHASIDVRESEVLGEIRLQRELVTVQRPSPGEITWKARLKHGPAITPEPARRLALAAKRIVEPVVESAPEIVGDRVLGSISPSRGVSVWSGMTFRDARLRVRKRFGNVGRPTPAVVIDAHPRRAVRFDDDLTAEKIVSVLEATEGRVICPSENEMHWSTREGRDLFQHRAPIRKLGRTGGFPVFARENQDLPLEDETLSARLRGMPWILAAWFLSLWSTSGCVGIEVWRTHPDGDAIVDAHEIAEVWQDITGPTRVVIVCRDSSPPRWVYVDEDETVSEIYPIHVAMRSLCYLAG